MATKNSRPEGVISGDGLSTNENPHAEGPPVEGSLDDLEGGKSLGADLPKAGERWVVDGQLAEIITYDVAANLYTAERQVGRSVDRVTNHITGTRFEPLSGGSQKISQDGLDFAQRENSMVSTATAETVDEGLARVTASQGNQFTSYEQQNLLDDQPHAGDSQEVAVAKIAAQGDSAPGTPSDSGSVDPAAPAEQTDSASSDTAQSE